MRIRHFAISLEATDATLVERPGPGLAPTAFRIWAAGENTSDDGPTLFTPKSADLLLAEQAARGRLYPSDFDHLSLVSNRPAEAGRASGYHRLEVRTGPMGPELWAVDIEWCADVKAGLEEQPPTLEILLPRVQAGRRRRGVFVHQLCSLHQSEDSRSPVSRGNWQRVQTRRHGHE